MGPRKLEGLTPLAFQHPFDRMALNALKHTAGFDKLINKINEWGLERILRIQLTGSYLRVTEDSFSEVHEVLVQACDILDYRMVPELYIAPGGEVNAFTAGTSRPLIVVNSGAIDVLTREELLFVIAHELGHIMCGHSLYYQVADFLPAVGKVIGAATLGFGELMSVGVQVALLHWKRMSEFTCDRAGLLACQDANAAIGAMVKIAGLPHKYFDRFNLDDFINQAKSFTEMDADTVTRLAKYVSLVGNTHPWTVARAHQFLDWVDKGEYGAVLEYPRKVPIALPTGVTSFCTQCGNALKGEQSYCPSCGAKLSAHALTGGPAAMRPVDQRT